MQVIIILVVIRLLISEVIGLVLVEIVIDFIMAGITDVVTTEAIDDTINSITIFQCLRWALPTLMNYSSIFMYIYAPAPQGNIVHQQ
jgi:hypothetical protein